ncbi:MAG TPA: hypothetical protein EYP11_04845, partial [Aquificaceae bacterium]|nr:hypothetical protein [Aquificaceae bacterium]
MKIGDFLKERGLSVGDNARSLLEGLGLSEKLAEKLELRIGEIAKMSKSKGNTVDPESAIRRYGADTVRLYILFAAPPEQDFEWKEEGIEGAHRFLNRLWKFVTEREEELKSTHYDIEELRSLGGKARKLRREVYATLRACIRDIEERYQLNTAIAKLMKLFNEMSTFKPESDGDRKALKEGVEILLLLLSPITPHICEELWHRIGKDTLIALEKLPAVDEEALAVEEVEIPVQVNGKVRAPIKIPY